MELKRLEKSLTDRWAFVLAIAAIGVIAALVFGSISQRNQTGLWEATAAVRFVAAEGQAATLPEEIESAEGVANGAAADLLDANPGSYILADLPNQRLTFVSRGTTREEAIVNAEALLHAYQSVDPEAGVPVAELIADLEAEAVEIQAQINELQPEPTPEEVELAGQHEFIDAQISAINQALVGLVVQEAGTDADTRAAIAGQRRDLNAQRTALLKEKAALPPAPTEINLDPQQALMLAALQSRLAALTLEYENLYLRESGNDGREQTNAVDLTPEAPSPWVNAAIGLLGGLIIAVLAVLFVNRTRRPVWLAEDISVAQLGAVPARKVNPDTSENWYDTAEPGERKSAIQAIRAAIEAQVPPTGATIGLTSHSVPSEDVQALAADLASSLASAGTSVLLVDANFASRSSLGQYRVGGASVSGILALNPATPEFEAQLHHAVDNAFRIRPGLSVIPSGPPPPSPADALAGRQFRQLVSVAQELYDDVVVVVDEIDSPAAQVALQRLGFGILVLTPGNSTIPEVDTYLRDVERLHITVLGSIFVGKHNRFSRFGSRDQKNESKVVTEDKGAARKEVASPPAQSPISRLQSYPIPDQRNTAVVPHASLDNLASEISELPSPTVTSDDVSRELLSAIDVADPERALDSVSRYLITQTGDMVMARHGYGGLSPEIIGYMSDYGFLSLRPLRGFKTAAGWLDHEIAAETSEASAVELMETMGRTLARGDEVVRIDDWLTDEFFIRHLEETGGEPSVWHLMSPNGNVSVLVPARRMTVQQFELILGEVASRTIDEFERYRSSMVSRADLEQAAVYEDAIEDVRKFERAVVSLITGDAGSKRRNGSGGWHPDWAKGTRANLAPLQAAGLLPFNVLTPSELSETLASA